MNSIQISKLKKDILTLSSEETRLIVSIKELKNSNGNEKSIRNLESKRDVCLSKIDGFRTQLYNLENR